MSDVPCLRSSDDKSSVGIRVFTLFLHRHEHTYLYTVSGSSSCVAATDSRSGLMLTCTATFRVLKKCNCLCASCRRDWGMTMIQPSCQTCKGSSTTYEPGPGYYMASTMTGLFAACLYMHFAVH